MKDAETPAGEPQRPAVVLNLTIDAMSGRIVTALRDAGVPSLLLKGPVIARRLYPRSAIRPYADCDLLVRRRDLALAEATVAGLGMQRETAWEQVSPAWELHHRSWRLEERHFDLELHWTLIHMGADPETVWEVCNRDCRTLRVGGVEVSVPSDPQLALNVALHSAQHGGDWTRPQEDLRRAVEVFPREVWRAAAERAVELHATQGFAAGLRLIPAGEQLAAALALPDEPSFEVLLTTGRAGEQALQVDRFLRAPGLFAKARVALRAAFPPAAVVRSRHLSARGGRGLALGYVMQWIRVARKVGSGTRNRRRAHREIDRR